MLGPPRRRTGRTLTIFHAFSISFLSEAIVFCGGGGGGDGGSGERTTRRRADIHLSGSTGARRAGEEPRAWSSWDSLRAVWTLAALATISCGPRDGGGVRAPERCERRRPAGPAGRRRVRGGTKGHCELACLTGAKHGRKALVVEDCVTSRCTGGAPRA